MWFVTEPRAAVTGKCSLRCRSDQLLKGKRIGIHSYRVSADRNKTAFDHPSTQRLIGLPLLGEPEAKQFVCYAES
jgi:hypothetical protein